MAAIMAYAVGAACMQACTAGRCIVHNFADLDDYEIFANRGISTSAASPLRTLPRVPRFIADMRVPAENGASWGLEQYLDATRTAAFVVLRDDRVVYERYGRGFDEHALLNSFSIAKPILATLVGIAVSEGRIASLDAKVTDYCPEFRDTPYGVITLKSLLTMTSGMDDAPTLLPARAEYYYGDDLHAAVAHAIPVAQQGKRWRYSEADAQVLGFVLQAAVGKHVSDYLAEKLWKPLGMESNALWALDREGGSEKTFCCISARVRDFARYGLLYLNGGRWNGRQILAPEWAANAVLPDTRTLDGYALRHFWWFPPGEQGDFYAYGYDGQYVYVNRAAHTVIVKFSETSRQDPLPMFRAVARALAPPARAAELDWMTGTTLAQH